MASFAKYFKQEVEGNVKADVDLVIRLPGGPQDAAPVAKRIKVESGSWAAAADAAAPAAADAAAPAAADALHLASFPAHNLTLDSSNYFKTQQGEAWQQLHCDSTTASSGSSAAPSSRPTVHLTIDSAEQLPAAEAVIQAMYGVPDAFSSLEQQQLVYAVVIADMLDVEAAGQQAQAALAAATASEQGLAAAALQLLADLPVWPTCLLQLLPVVVAHAPCCAGGSADLVAIRAADPGSRVQRLLVAVLGDLQAVWADADLTAMLLRLPLTAMQLLLSSSRLLVPSEDTVLFAARRFVQAQRCAGAKAAARGALARLVRAPHLSQSVLSLSTLPNDDWRQLLSAYQQDLCRLQHLKRIASPQEVAAAVEEWDEAQASWLRPMRILRSLEDGVRLEWRLPVERLKQACKDCFERQDSVWLHSLGSPPLGGMAWKLLLICKQADGGTMVGLHVGPAEEDMPAGGYYKFTATVTWQNRQQMLDSPCIESGRAFGNFNPFQLKPMAAGDWDETAWASGLPATGEMLMRLHLHSVE